MLKWGIVLAQDGMRLRQGGIVGAHLEVGCPGVWCPDLGTAGPCGFLRQCVLPTAVPWAQPLHFRIPSSLHDQGTPSWTRSQLRDHCSALRKVSELRGVHLGSVQSRRWVCETRPVAECGEPPDRLELREWG